MREGTGFDSVEVEFSFIGTIVDKHCSLELFEDVTDVYTKYVDVVNQIYRQYLFPGWTMGDLKPLSQKIQ